MLQQKATEWGVEIQTLVLKVPNVVQSDWFAV